MTTTATPAVLAFVEDKWQEAFSNLNHHQPGISGLMTLSKAWKIAADFLRPRPLSQPRPKYNPVEVKMAFDVLGQTRLLYTVLENFLDDMHQQEYLIKHEVEEYMSKYEETDDPRIIAQLVNRLVEWFNAWHPLAEYDSSSVPDLWLADSQDDAPKSLGHVVTDHFTVAFHTHIYSILPPSFSRGFKVLVASTLPISDDMSDNVKLDQSAWESFFALGLVERYESLIASVCYEHIEGYIRKTCEGKWSEKMLTGMREWMTKKMVPWMCLPYARGAKNSEEAGKMMSGVGSRFDYHVCKVLCDLRTSEIFDMIVDFPDSKPALEDLKECLHRVDQRSNLVSTLRKANKKRLLHPGADTKDILTQYVSIIKCLRVVDPPGVLLYKVADPIRRYLRDRPDTIRCIVADLVGDGENGTSLVDDNDPLVPLVSRDVEDYTDVTWEPEPLDAGPDFRANKPGDIVSTLVSIYESKDLFVKELQVLLAQRLLNVTDGNYEKERRNIEILKVRFGEAALQVCEVMLRDMTDSRRIDQHVQSQKPSLLHPIIISRHFWPTLQTGTFTLPSRLRAVQEEYAREYTAFKPDKKLVWLSHMGTVKIEVELQDRTLEVDVPPVSAAIVELFSERDRWSVDELIAQMGRIDRPSVSKGLLVLVDLGILKEEETDNYRLLEIAEEPSSEPGAVPASRSAISMDELPGAQTAQQQQAEQVRMYWKFIEGMLTNLGLLPLDRIQTMLKFAPGYDRSIEQLGMYMEAARREGLVVAKDGMWRLNR
ncbi:ubiquitin-protein ligase [Heliocybe sulcata]|uniref:Anaphase-promoting complex subunit 2 n=1 Tax=Heliocybe sulcata TaxID=5364 RepID=A0A5C3N4W3_9AGAM|nr:ubiquitin-protein ligase [Heliocybe sulcata]